MTPREPLRIGPIEVSPRLLLAPMSGVTDSAFRRVVRRASGRAVGLMLTEFISVEALTRDNEKSVRMMRFRPEGIVPSRRRQRELHDEDGADAMSTVTAP